MPGPPPVLPIPPGISVPPTKRDPEVGASDGEEYFFDYSVKLEDGHAVRNYQQELAKPGLEGKNYIIIAPTGSGKTLVSALVISDHLQKYQRFPVCHVIFIVETGTLAMEQKEKLDKLIPAARVEVYTGKTNNRITDSIKANNISVCTAGKLLDEVRKSTVNFKDFSLIIMDECHHTIKAHAYAEVMGCLLEQRNENPDLHLPQVIGMTASPGAGDNPTLITKKTLDHLLTLAALLDATGGIKTVIDNRDELEQYSKSSSFTRKILKPRDPDAFIAKIEDVMGELELKVGMENCHLSKWSQEYETKVQEQLKKPLMLSKDPKFRDQIGTLDLLRRYSNALSAYMDLQQSDAIEVLEEYPGFMEDDSKATPHEKDLKYKMRRLIEELKGIPPTENPLLNDLKKILSEAFGSCPNSRAILFVRTKKHASSLCKWASKNLTLKSLEITPDVITGHTRKSDEGMTQMKQEEVMSRFHKGRINLLIATSVAEEGLDVPECNLVIRFLHVSNEIAKKQAEGRARADNSQGFTILRGDSKKKYQEMKNEELLKLVEEILECDWFPTGKHLEKRLADIQASIIEKRKQKVMLKRKRERTHDSEDVLLRCKKCKTVACSGPDIYTIGEDSFHHVVPRPDFKKKIKLKEHKKREHVIADQAIKTHKVHCSECEQDWGVMCTWPSNGNEFPIIKCTGFLFEIKGQPQLVRKWSNVPFTMDPLSTWFDQMKELEGDSATSDNED